MKKIHKNATTILTNILTNAQKILFSTHDNGYKPTEGNRLTEREIKSTTDDIKNGYAIMYDLGNREFMLRYAGACRWYIQSA